MSAGRSAPQIREKIKKSERTGRKIILPHQSEEFFESPADFDEIKSTKTVFCGRALTRGS